MKMMNVVKVTTKNYVYAYTYNVFVNTEAIALIVVTLDHMARMVKICLFLMWNSLPQLELVN